MGYVIIEGPDGTGKSTLAEELMDLYGATYQHVGPPDDPKHAFAEYVRDLRAWKNAGRVVLDRFHLGTYVYGRAFREGSDFNELEWELLEEMLWEDVPGAVVVLCTPPTDRILFALTAKEDEGIADNYDDQHRSSELVGLFNQAFDKSTLPKIRYDWTKKGDFGDLTGLIWEHLGWTPVDVLAA